jgi:Holliday junction resolvasome RuvABC endonuclease subunit
MKVMGVDTGTITGVTAESADGRPEFHTLQLKTSYDEDDHGYRYMQLDQRLSDLITIYRPTVLAYEEPIIPRVQKGRMNVVTTAATLKFLIGIAAVIDLIGKRHGLDVIEVNIATWKAHFASNGHASKADVMRRCQLLGWDIRNEHEADSAGVWAYVKAVMDPKFSYQATPMFAEVGR